MALQKTWSGDFSVSVAKRKFRAYCKEIKNKENKAINNYLNNY